jgi:hypothetical protein
VRKLFRRDYVRDLRRNLSYRDLRTFIETASELWPRLNRESVGVAPREQMATLAAAMHLHFKATRYAGPEGLALRGFYVGDADNLLKRPLVYVNTAHHPVAVSAAFCHEIGHHMARSLFTADHDPVHLFFDADYASHLDDPTELAADVVVALAAYPEPVARRIFAEAAPLAGLVAQTRELSDDAFARVRARIESQFGLNFTALKPAGQAIRYLAGMIHFAKLRWALLAEYEL